MSARLPEGFAPLEPFVDRWTGDTSASRAHLRDSASAEELKAFYAATQPLVEQALDLLDTKSFAEHDEREQRLLKVMLAYAHAAVAVEVQGPDEAKHTELRKHLRIVNSPADTG